VFLFFVAPSLAVFYHAYAFNQDVSKWETGAVTTMECSKWTLSLSVGTRPYVLFVCV
jgi:surface protein